ncbi:TonB-dependent receptor plug domain-containing protein [Persephonella sp. IF05-L8]|uniref:TonB-dependent receptor plug domain-containing protein n=1 Tax=Persephonella sp. IF05-L8 TaxID=1158338 RepID=UPI0004972AC1
MAQILLTVFLVLSFISYGQSLEKLLDKYAELNKLYKKTIQETEGHLILFTREDIQKLQAYKLSDILKYIRYFTLIRNQYGENVLSYASVYPLENSTIRLFINDHEISGIYKKTPLSLWADMPLDNVDHIEIYQGESALKFNNEAAGMIIKVYTKRPETENTKTIRVSTSTRKDYSFSVYIAGETSAESSAFLLINRETYKSKKYLSDLQINNRYYYISGGFYLPRLSIETGIAIKGSNNFRGDTLISKPEYSDSQSSHGYISISRLLSTELKLKLRFYADKINTSEYEKGDLSNPVFIRYPPLLVSSYSKQINSTKIGTEIVGEYQKNKTKLFYGTKIQYSRYRLIQQIPFTNLTDRNWENYRSFYIENVYNLKPKLGLVAGIKYENTERGYGQDIEGIIWRIGLVYLINKLDYFKLFLSRYYTPPSFIETHSNHNLKKQENKSLTLEYSAIYPIGKLTITAGTFIIKDSILISPSTYNYINTPEKLKYYFWSVEYHKNFLQGNYITTMYFKVYPTEEKYKTISSEGGLIRLGKQHKNYSVFIENIYRKGYSFYGIWIKSGAELNAGIKINLTENTKIAIKGSNLLTKAIKTPLLIDKNIQVSQEDKRVLITLEKDF